MANTLNEALHLSGDDNTIIPGTTPQLTFEIDNDIILDTVSVRMDVKQDGVIIDQVMNTDIEDHRVSYVFKQDETYRMKPGQIQIQLHGLTDEDCAWKSNIITIPVGESLSGTMI